MLNNVVKCLMIGKAGIGKSAFLAHLPNVETTTATPHGYRVETLNSRFEKVTLEIDCCDVTLETCMHDAADLLATNNNKVLPTALDDPTSSPASRHFINTSRFHVVVLAFATNDPVSFELVKSKWEVDFKRNKKGKHAFVLLGLKEGGGRRADEQLVAFVDHLDPNMAEVKLSKLRATIKKLSPKSRRPADKSQRSLSVSSLSSTSKIHRKKLVGGKNNKANSDGEDDDDDEYDETYFGHEPSAITSSFRRLSLNQYKKFAKLISSSSHPNFIHHESQDPSDLTASSLTTYNKFVESVVRCSEALATATAATATVPKTGSSGVAKLTRSFTAPLTRPLHMFARRGNKHHKIDESLVMIEKQRPTTTMVVNESVKDKLTRLAVHVGTYIVTCGTAKSRKLKQMRKLEDTDTINEEMAEPAVGVTAPNAAKGKRKLLARFAKRRNNKSFMLLSSSQMSVNSVEDHVFDE